MKKYDVVAVTGEYQNQQGETKKRYQNVGAIIDKGNGPFLILESWFNPAGVAKDGAAVLSLFEPKISQAKAKVQEAAHNDLEDSIPF